MPELNDDLLERVQEDAVARVRSADFFHDSIWVEQERKGLVANDITRALSVLNSQGGRIGVAVIASMPVVDVEDPNVAGPELLLRLTWQVFENRMYNNSSKGTGKSAEAITLNLLSELHHYFPEGLGLHGELMADKRAIVPAGADDKLTGYVVIFTARTGLSRVDKVSKPTISIEDDLVTLASATAGAAIYYTTDGSYPGRANEAATLYTEPFAAPEAGTQIRAGARADGYIQSSVRAAAVE